MPSTEYGKNSKAAPGPGITRVPSLILSNSVALPYYRFYRQNTLLPILEIAKSLRDEEDAEKISVRLRHWRERKLDEFHFVQVASTLLAAAVIGCFSWNNQPTEHWLGPASWYCSLVLSVCAMLLSSSEAFIFSTIKTSPGRPVLLKELAMIIHLSHAYWEHHDDGRRAATVREGNIPAFKPNDPASAGKQANPRPPRPPVEVKVRWNMVFTWQAPIMLMAYSVIGFAMGLIIYVCTPLYDGSEFDGPSKTAVTFIVMFASSGGVFVWCSFWAYKFVELNEGEI